MLDHLLVGLAAVAAGAVNAVAGGGTLITFPVLIAIGAPAVEANVTNAVALCPGFLGAALAQRADMVGQRQRLSWLIPAGAIGGMLGAIILLHTGERTFRALVPFLILLASGLLALQTPIRAWLTRRSPNWTARSELWAVAPIALASIYGGYFGAGLSVILLSVLGLTINDTLTRLNASKQAIALSANVAAAALFLFSGRVQWSAAAVMAIGAAIGGAIGGRWARRIEPSKLRWTVVGIGLIVSAIYFLRW